MPRILVPATQYQPLHRSSDSLVLNDGSDVRTQRRRAGSRSTAVFHRGFARQMFYTRRRKKGSEPAGPDLFAKRRRSGPSRKRAKRARTFSDPSTGIIGYGTICGICVLSLHAMASTSVARCSGF